MITSYMTTTTTTTTNTFVLHSRLRVEQVLTSVLRDVHRKTFHVRPTWHFTMARCTLEPDRIQPTHVKTQVLHIRVRVTPPKHINVLIVSWDPKTGAAHKRTLSFSNGHDMEAWLCEVWRRLIPVYVQRYPKAHAIAQIWRLDRAPRFLSMARLCQRHSNHRPPCREDVLRLGKQMSMLHAMPVITNAHRIRAVESTPAAVVDAFIRHYFNLVHAKHVRQALNTLHNVMLHWRQRCLHVLRHLRA